MLLAAAILATASALGVERTVSDLAYPSADGRENRAVLSMPKGDGPFPLIVTVHGGNSEKPYGYLRTMAGPNRLSSIVDDLNRQPWAILAVSYRNGFMNQGDEDVIAGIRFGMSLPGIDKSRVGLLGGSHGGYKVLQAAIRMGEEIACVAAGSPWMVDPVAFMQADASKEPFSLIDAKVAERLAAQAGTLRRQIVLRQGSEEAADLLLKEHSAWEHCAKIKAPLLLMTSRADESVPHELVAPLYERMKANGQRVEMFTVKESPHGFYWGRLEGARASSQPKTPSQHQEERETSARIIQFFSAHFAKS